MANGADNSAEIGHNGGLNGKAPWLMAVAFIGIWTFLINPYTDKSKSDSEHGTKIFELNDHYQTQIRDLTEKSDDKIRDLSQKAEDQRYALLTEMVLRRTTESLEKTQDASTRLERWIEGEVSRNNHVEQDIAGLKEAVRILLSGNYHIAPQPGKENNQ